MSGSNLVQSLVRGLEILELVARSESGLTLAELASALGVQRPTAFNLARTLVSKGYLEKTSRPVHYALGPGIGNLHRIHQSYGWRARAGSELARLLAALDDGSVSIAEPHAGEIQLTFRIDSSQPDRVVRPLGQVLAPYTMAMSLCFQAFWPASERERYESRYPFADYGRGVWTNRATLESFLAMSRRKGVVERRPADLCRIAAPVYGHDGHVVAAVAASRSLGAAGADSGIVAAMVREVRLAAGNLSAS